MKIMLQKWMQKQGISETFNDRGGKNSDDTGTKIVVQEGAPESTPQEW